MERPFHDVWEKTRFRGQDGYKLVVDALTAMFIAPGYVRRGETEPRDYQWYLMLGSGRKIAQRGYVMTDGLPADEALPKVARHAIQQSLTYLHERAVQFSYAATNLRVLSGVADASLASGESETPAPEPKPKPNAAETGDATTPKGFLLVEVVERAVRPPVHFDSVEDARAEMVSRLKRVAGLTDEDVAGAIPCGEGFGSLRAIDQDTYVADDRASCERAGENYDWQIFPEDVLGEGVDA